MRIANQPNRLHKSAPSTRYKFSRRTFVQTVWAALLAAGCWSDDSEPEAVTSSTASLRNFQGTTLPPGDVALVEAVVQQYLLAWEQRNYEAMYDLLSPEAQHRTPYVRFFAAYQNAHTQTTAIRLQTQRQSLLLEGSTATATFQSQWVTALFGSLQADHLMKLRFDQGQWRIAWEPTLILPQLGHGVTLVFLEDQPQRGLIFDAVDQAIATHEQQVTIGVVPGLVEDEAQLVTRLTAISNLTADEIQAKLAAAQPDWFVPLVDMDFAESVQYHETLSTVAGLQRQARPVRTYPGRDTAAHILGTMGRIPNAQLPSYRAQGYQGDELIGLSGVEGWGELFLAGRRGGRLVTMTTGNKPLADVATAAPRPGGNIYLHLNTELQKRAEAILGARRGAIVAMQPNGFIKAMASYPRFLPEDFSTGIDVDTWSGLINDEHRPLINRATQGLYPPASVFKMITMAAAIEHLGYTPDTSFFCPGHWNGLGNNFIKKCWLETGHGNIGLQDGLTQSCDIVFYEIGLALHRSDPNWLPNMARAFGLGQASGIMGIMNFEDGGGVVPDQAWKTAVRNQPFFDGDAVNMAIGQGDILVTPLQIARLIAALANGGTLYRPQLIRQISSRDAGDQFFEPEITGQLPISSETLSTIQDGMFWVAHGRKGTAREAFRDVGYSVVGKTGTAETFIDQPHAWFAGYTPADVPQIIIVAIIEHAGEGSKKAAPLFRAMADTYFSLAATE